MALKFNWDDINSGNYKLNHSENFFANFHNEHEKIIGVQQNNISIKMENKENILEQPQQQEQHNKMVTISDQRKIIFQLEYNSSKKLKPLKNVGLESNTKTLTKPLGVHDQQLRKPINGKINTKPDPPKVFKYTEIYENKKKAMIEKINAIEKKNREFHSRPVPNFNKQGIPEPKPILITMPITPAVLKHKKSEKVSKQKLDEFQKSRKQFVHNPNEPPFVPKLNRHPISIQPFNLRTEERSESRRKFDAYISKKNEEKKKQEEEEIKKLNEQLDKECRKMSQFKARPNPFK